MSVKKSWWFLCILLAAFAVFLCVWSVSGKRSPNRTAAGSGRLSGVSSAVSSGEAGKSSSLAEEGPDEGVNVLLYHDIMTPETKGSSVNGLIVTTTEFDRQMSLLHRNGYSSIDLDQLYLYVTGRQKFYHKVVITFDDGYKATGNLAAPILQKYGFRAAVFVITSTLDNPDEVFNPRQFAPFQYLNHHDLINFKDTLEFASHTDNLHQDLTKVGDSARLSGDLALSRQKLGGTPYFSYPLGKNDARVRELVRNAGFKMAVTTRFATARMGTDPYQVPRKEVVSSITDSEFCSYVGIQNTNRK